MVDHDDMVHLTKRFSPSRLFVLVFGVFLLQACAAQMPRHTGPWRCDEAADQAVTDQDWEKALRGHEQIVADQPDNCLALYHLGYILGNLNRREDEIAYYRKAIDCGYVDDDQLYFNLGMAYGDRRQYKLAQEAFSNAVRIDPQNADNYFGMGLTAEMAGRRQFAENALLKAVALQPGHWDARLALARLYLSGNGWQNAEIQIEAVLKADPENAEALELRETLRSRKSIIY